MTVGNLTQNNASLMQQLLNHPNLREGTEEQLERGSYTIVKKNDSNFCLRWLNNEGREVSVPFNISNGYFCFKNGQAHQLSHLDKMISEIFEHYK